MKKVVAVSLMSLVGFSSASELDLQPKQWSVELKPTTAGLNMDGYSTKIPNSELVTVEGEKKLNISFAGAYKYSDKLQLGGYVFVSSSVDSESSKISGLQFSDDVEKDFRYQINPYLEYYVLPNVALRSEVSYYFNNANVRVDINGNESTAGNSDYSNSELWLGAVYRKDIKENVLLDARAMFGIGYIESVNADDVNINYQQTYNRASYTADARYFLTDNFSVNGGLGVYAGALKNQSNNGVESDLSNYKWSYLNIGTRFGFTYYHR